MKKRHFLIPLPFLLVFFFGPLLIEKKEDHFDPLPTEFAYSEEKLKETRSPQLITLERIDKWEEPLQKYFSDQNISPSVRAHFYTYLYIAQRDAAFLSFNAHHCFIGSLDPLTAQIVQAFFPDFSAFPEMVTDPYSEQLAQEVWGKLKNGAYHPFLEDIEVRRLREIQLMRENRIPLGRTLNMRAKLMKGEYDEMVLDDKAIEPRKCPYSK